MKTFSIPVYYEVDANSKEEALGKLEEKTRLGFTIGISRIDLMLDEVKELDKASV